MIDMEKKVSRVWGKMEAAVEWIPMIYFHSKCNKVEYLVE
jgi:hypothetical protein